MLLPGKKTYLVAACLLSLATLLYWQTRLNLPSPDSSLRMQKTTGEIKQLRDYQGKFILVSFWATSCIICLKEINQLVDFYQLNQENNFEILAISMYHDRPDWVVQTIKDKNISYPVFFDIDKQISKNFGNVIATPTSFIISPAGDVIYQHAGKTDFRRISEIINKQT